MWKERESSGGKKKNGRGTREKGEGTIKKGERWGKNLQGPLFKQTKTFLSKSRKQGLKKVFWKGPSAPPRGGAASSKVLLDGMGGGRGQGKKV